jgi:hypothetical protein
MIRRIAVKTYEADFANTDEVGRYIDKEAYKAMIWQNPECVRWLSVDLARVTEGARLLT